MTRDRETPVDRYLSDLGRTSEVELAVSSLDALLGRFEAPPESRAPLPLWAIAAEHVRERRLAECDRDSGLKGPNALRRWLGEALRASVAPRVPLLIRVQLLTPGRGGAAVLPLLRELALVLRDNIAASDLLARSGERELVVLMRAVDPSHAPAIGERLARVCRELTERLDRAASVRIALQLFHRPPPDTSAAEDP